MSWKSIQGQVAGSTQKVAVVKTTGGGFEAVYNRLKQEYNNTATTFQSINATNNSLIRNPQLAAHQVMTDLFKIVMEIQQTLTSIANPGREWNELLFQTQKLSVQSAIMAISDVDNQINEINQTIDFVYELALSNLLLMEDMGKRDLIIIKNSLWLARYCGDEWTFRRLSHDFQDDFQGVFGNLLKDVDKLPVSKKIIDIPPKHDPTLPTNSVSLVSTSTLSIVDESQAVEFLSLLIKQIADQSSSKTFSLYNCIESTIAQYQSAAFALDRMNNDNENSHATSDGRDETDQTDHFTNLSTILSDEGIDKIEQGQPEILLTISSQEVQNSPKPERMSTRHKRGSKRQFSANLTEGATQREDSSELQLSEDLQELKGLFDTWQEQVPLMQKYFTLDGLSSAYHTQKENEAIAAAEAAAERAKEEAKLRQDEELESKKRDEELWKSQQAVTPESLIIPKFDWLVTSLHQLLAYLQQNSFVHNIEREYKVASLLLKMMSQWVNCFLTLPIGFVRHHWKQFPWTFITIAVMSCGEALLRWNSFLPNSQQFTLLDADTVLLLFESALTKAFGGEDSSTAELVIQQLFVQWQPLFPTSFPFTPLHLSSNSSEFIPHIDFTYFRQWWISMRYLYETYFSTSRPLCSTTVSNEPKSNKKNKLVTINANNDHALSDKKLWVDFNMDYGELLGTVLQSLQSMQEIFQKEEQTLNLPHITVSDWQMIDKYHISLLKTQGEACLQQYLLQLSLDETKKMMELQTATRLIANALDGEQLRKFIDALSYDILNEYDESSTSIEQDNSKNESKSREQLLVETYFALGRASSISLPLFHNITTLITTKQYLEAMKILQSTLQQLHALVTSTAESSKSSQFHSVHFQRGIIGFLGKITATIEASWPLTIVLTSIEMQEFVEIALDVTKWSQQMYLYTGNTPTSALSLSLWLLFLQISQRTSQTISILNEVKQEVANKTFIISYLRPVAQKLCKDLFIFVIEQQKEQSLMPMSIRTTLEALAELFILTLSDSANVSLLEEEENLALSKIISIDLLPVLTQDPTTVVAKDMHACIILGAKSIACATSSHSFKPTPFLAISAENRFKVANFLDELILQHLTSTTWCLHAMDAIQQLAYDCLFYVKDMQTANFQDACIILTHAYSALYDFPIGGLNHLGSDIGYHQITVDAMTRMYTLLKACSNMKSFTKADIREAQQWLVKQDVLQRTIVNNGPYQTHLQAYFNANKILIPGMEDMTENNVYLQVSDMGDQFLSTTAQSTAGVAPPIVHIFADLLDTNAITNDIVNNDSEEAFSSLKEAYPYLTYLEDHPALDGKVSMFVHLAFEYLSYVPQAIDTWLLLLQKVQSCMYGLSDFLNQHMDVPPAKEYLNTVYLNVFHGEPDSIIDEPFIGDKLWKLNPESWMNEVIPGVEAMYKFITSPEQELAFSQWLENSMIKDLWLHHVKATTKGSTSVRSFSSGNMNSHSSNEECSLPMQHFIKALLLTDLLKRMCETMTDKIYTIARRLMPETSHATWDKRYFASIESYAVHRILMAKEYSVPRRHRMFESIIPILTQENYLDNSLFALTMTAKFRWQTRYNQKQEFVFQEICPLLSRTYKLISEDVQNNSFSKVSKIHALYYIASLRLKISLSLLDMLPDESTNIVGWLTEVIATIRLENAGFSQTSVPIITIPVEEIMLFAPGITTQHQIDVISMACELCASAAKGLNECRKRDIYHFRTQYSISDLASQLCTMNNLPSTMKEYIQSLFNWTDTTQSRSLLEIHKLFEKKRAQILAMWSTDNPTQPWDVLLARISEFDGLRRKYSKRYLTLIQSCGELDMVWQLLQQILTKVAYPAIHDMLISSAQTYLEITLQFIVKRDIVDISFPTDVLVMPLECFQSNMEQGQRYMEQLQEEMRFYQPMLDNCYQLYTTIQKRKSPIAFLLDELESVMKHLLERLAPLSASLEQVMETMKNMNERCDLRNRDHSAMGCTLVMEDDSTSNIPESLSAVIAVEQAPTLSIPQLRGESIQVQMNSSSVAPDEMLPMETLTPTTDALPKTPTAVTLPKYHHFNEAMDTKELLAFVASLLVPSKSNMISGSGHNNTATAGTAASNKRSRSQMSTSEDNEDYGQSLSKQARRATSHSQLLPTSRSESAMDVNEPSTVEWEQERAHIPMDEEVML